ncbi:aminopeptidase N [Bermanella marisrubri]|uniref:Aminopeptidase N n=1 Tax=Bermanella marisrubri TaxID=207949 RepID=Q1N0L3_9GAMM|nr:aminopeptidase N [Bermanella marisrubri]EAT11820.1 aminopeptidase N [Oceanobacter sp. RED65] [Bermanella marisrubri]QIZ83854.1 aminopeptidase N [Bermanella marisrubri]
MKDAQPKAIYLKDYEAPKFTVLHTALTFLIEEEATEVHSLLSIQGEAAGELKLNGQALELVSVELDGGALSEGSDFSVDDDFLVIHQIPAHCKVAIKTRIKPQENTALEGLYKSAGMYCTQCEAEGFRRITYFLDRPDVMSIYDVTIIADKSKYPVLLSNGNLVESKELEGGKHLAHWHDPHKKPCYLFALVAGDLRHIEDRFTTMSGTDVTLRIYVEPQNIDKCDFAMDALKRSMKWDEERYGREYDLDIFNIVAVDDFNMGAMENKSLNIFNSSCVLANSATATDNAYSRIEAIVAHEYFHNWSGNRVTCRDWFQLSLKEGFTVFRDSQFSSDMSSPVVKRIDDVNLLRTAQFAEDAGPMAHPIRPASFIEISNFYTLTIYEKGAEVVRMIHNLLGEDKFREGSDLYFQRHDGQAVTTEEFVKAMEDASGIDLTQFRNWYHQAGTPELSVTDQFDETTGDYKLFIKQTCRPTPESDKKEPFHIPMALGLLDEEGNDAQITLKSDGKFNQKTQVLSITEPEQEFIFSGFSAKPTPSLLRDFSAPVKLHYPYTREQLLFLLAHDSDGFNRWDAGQTLATDIVLELSEQVQAGEPLEVDDRLIETFEKLLKEDSSDKAMLCKMLSLPSLAFLIEQSVPANVHAIYTARTFVRQTLANQLHEAFLSCYQQNHDDEPYNYSAEGTGKRSLKSLCLHYLLESDQGDYSQLAISQYQNSDNLTDQHAALSALANSRFQVQAKACLDEFYEKWQHEPLVVNLWLSMLAGSDRIDGVEGVEELIAHPAFDIKNPNKVRSVIGVFAGQNLRHFHTQTGAGYEWLADKIILLDRLNPQIAARLVGPLTKWQRIVGEGGQKMRNTLARIESTENLSKDVYEVVSKSLVES